MREEKAAKSSGKKGEVSRKQRSSEGKNIEKTTKSGKRVWN